jgi:hypothetical protein
VCRNQLTVNPRGALRRSFSESRTRQISKAELCRQEWSFRFKKTAGAAWTTTDPWWNGQPARTLRNPDLGLKPPPPWSGTRGERGAG